MNYVPRYVVNFPAAHTGFTFYTKSVQAGTFVRDMTDEDRAFLTWLEAQPGETSCPECHGFRLDKDTCAHCGGRGIVPCP